MVPEASEQPAPSRKARWGLGIRMVVSAVLLAILVTKIDFDGALPRHRHLSTLIFFAAAVLMATVGIVLSAWRWQRVLLAFGAPVPLRAAHRPLLRGSVRRQRAAVHHRWGRAARSRDRPRTSARGRPRSRPSPSSGSAASSRCPCSACSDSSSTRHCWSRAPPGSRCSSPGSRSPRSAAILLLAAHPKMAGRFQHHDNWMRFIGAAHIGVERLRSDPKAALAVLGTAMIYQVSVVLTVGVRHPHASGHRFPSAR